MYKKLPSLLVNENNSYTGLPVLEHLNTITPLSQIHEYNTKKFSITNKKNYDTFLAQTKSGKRF